MLWCWFQSYPVPTLAHPIWEEASTILPSVTHRGIAIDPHRAQSDSLRLISYSRLTALGLSLAALGHTQRAILATAAAIALFCLAAVLLASGLLDVPFTQIRQSGDAVFPFTNRNTFCAFAGVSGVIATASLASVPRRATFWWIGILILSLGGILASHSRAGLAATAFGMAVAVLLVRPGRQFLAVTSIAILMLIVASFLTLTGIRLAGLPADLDVRIAIWRATSVIVIDHIWLGLGSLDHALQVGPGVWGERHILRAHNIYLQAVAERGLPGTAALLGALLLVLCHICKTLRKSRANARVAPPIAVATAVLFACQGLVDFSLHAPVNAAILSLLLGLAAGSTQPALLPQPAFVTNTHNVPFQCAREDQRPWRRTSSSM